MISRIGFGRYKRKSVEWVMFNDPAYVKWMYANPGAKALLPPAIADRLDFIVKRAQHLKVPKLCACCNRQPVTRMWMTCDRKGHLTNVEFVGDCCRYDGATAAYCYEPSFFHSDIFRRYDKKGAKALTGASRGAFFSPKIKRMSQKRAAAFFNDNRNFHV